MQEDDITTEPCIRHLVLAPDDPVDDTIGGCSGLPIQRSDRLTYVQVVLLARDGHGYQLLPFLRFEICIVWGAEHDRRMSCDTFDEQPGRFHFQDRPPLAYLCNVRLG